MRTRDAQFRIQCLIYGGLALVTFCLYLPALRHEFVNYDDQQYVTDNPRVQAGLTWHGLVWAFGFYAGNWHPLAWLSHMLDCQLYGAWAGGHHLTSVLLHVAGTLLLFAALNRMTKSPWRSAAVAALFAWHPLHVESVAWVAERKDVLCAFFWMLTLLAYARYVQKAESGKQKVETGGSFPSSLHHPLSSSWYCMSLSFFALALMAKPMAVTLPFVLLLLDFWPLKRVWSEISPKHSHIEPLNPCQSSALAFPGRGTRFSLSPGERAGVRASVIHYHFPLGVHGEEGVVRNIKAVIVEKIPFFLLSVGACVLTLHAQQIAIVSTAGLTIPHRIAHTLVAYNHYLCAMFVPVNLAVYYPYQIHLPKPALAGAVMVLALVTFLAVQNFRQRPYLIMGWLWFLGTLVPVIGLVQVGDQAWADRYTYLPLVGLFVMVVWLVSDLVKNRMVLRTVSALAAAGLLALTSLQLGYWQNTRTLFEHAAQVTPHNYLAITMLGSLLAKDHKYAEAVADYQQALRYEPTFPEAHFYLGDALDEQGKLDEALTEYSQALWFKPTQEQTHIFMGIVLGKQKKYDQAIAHYAAALKLNPDSAVTHNNLARLFHTLGRFDEAIVHYHAALELDPKLELAHNNLGVLLIQKGNLPEGIRQLREALRLKPGNAETAYNLALALNQEGQWNEAAELFKKTVAARPADAKAHEEFALALANSQKLREAMSEYASALLIQPDFPDALDGLAWILCTATNADFRNGTEAVTMAARACELTSREDPAKLKTLAAAYAEAGRFTDAIGALQSARDLALKAGRQELVNECARMLEQFQKSKSWREWPKNNG